MMDKVIQLWSKTNRWHRVLLIFLIVELRLLPKRQRGFECNDPALSYPYTGDTISWKWLLVTVAMLPLAVLLIVERIYSKNDSGASKQQALCWYKEYLFGVLINLTVVQTLKVLVGAPRPHFFDTCSPKEALTCTGSEYVSEYTCMKAHWLSQSDTSFPSGHTSLALHSGIFIAYYLHQRTRSLVKSKIILSAQILSVVSTVFCAVSRITDRRHHWWDVLAGAGIGIPILFYTVMAAVCILLEVGALPSRRSGFTCNDPALSFPHSGDTFSISLVAVVTVVVSFLIMWAVEAIHHREEEYMKQNRLVVSARSAGLLYRDYIYGAVVNLTVLEVVKCVIGSPRPTFFDLCEPDKAKTCNGSEFVSSYTCTSSRHGRYLVIDSTRSFPSAHASLSVYCGLFLAWYLQRRAFSWRNRSVLIVPLLQTCCLIYAAVCSLTRVTDHRHHWWDVLVGGSMGVLSVLYTVLVLCKNFSQPAVVSTSDISSSDGNNHQSVRRLLSSEPHVVVP